MIKYTINSRLKIYGERHCPSGKHLNVNHLLPNSENEAIAKGFYPCAHCLPELHQKFALHLRLPLR